MRILLDTHIILWALTDSKKLSAKASVNLVNFESLNIKNQI